MPDDKKKKSTRTQVVESVVIVLLLLILYVSFQYATLRMRYADIYSWYDEVEAKAPNKLVNIGPTRIVFSYEYPAWARVFMSRPITSEAANFLLRLKRVKGLPAHLMVGGPGKSYSKTEIPVLNALVSTEERWNSPTNPLYVYLGIPWSSALVRSYYNAAKGHYDADHVGDSYSLMVLWLYGFEEYVRERFTEGSTSVLSEWDYMFANVSDAPPRLPPKVAGKCNAAGVASSAMSGGIAGGIAIGMATGGPVGAVGGALAGTLVSMFSTGTCM